MAVKAYIIETDDPEVMSVQFATTNVAARRQGAGEVDQPFGHVSCKRLPWADKYAKSKIPESAYIANGWWYECASCRDKVDKDTEAPVFDLNLVFCSAPCHAAEVADRKAAEDRKQELIEAVLSKFPGVQVTYASTHESRRVADFRFPSGKDTVQWELGGDTVGVTKRDEEAWHAWREPFRKQ